MVGVKSPVMVPNTCHGEWIHTGYNIIKPETSMKLRKMLKEFHLLPVSGYLS